MQENMDSDKEGRSPRPAGSDQADPDVLRDLIQQSRGVPLNVQRITSQEVQALKVKQRKEDNPVVAITRAFTGFFSGIFSAIGGIFAGPVKKKTQCDIYGHVRPKDWDGSYPTCVNCGIEITSEDMLRGATAKQ
ncbi:MAG TPA: hypothetical protein V6D08_11150 [Candidatus Obscuribacterales bacterium]